MNPRKQFRGRLLFPFKERNLVDEAFAFQGRISQPAIGMNNALCCDGVLHKGHRAGSRSVENLAHANPADARPILLCSNHNQRLVQIEPAGQIFLRSAEIAFIYFHSTGEQIASGPYHGATQPVQHGPGGFIPAQAQDVLQPQRAGAVLLRCHPPHGLKPKAKRNACVLKDRSRGHRNLMAAVMASQQHRPHRRMLLAATARTKKPLWPSQLQQILAAVLVAPKTLLELQQIPGIVFHPRILGVVPWWSSRVMALSGLRMMPLSPSPSLKFRTARFPRYGFKADISDGAFPSSALLKLAPSIRSPMFGLLPSFAPLESQTLLPALSREGALLAMPSFGLHSPAPGVLAPVGVIVSPSIST